jgi:8-amino-7-oxononanoate synthase
MKSAEDFLKRKLQDRANKGNLRSLSVAPTHGIDFRSNDYLGLVHYNLLQPPIDSSGSTGSRLISGNSDEIVQLEDRIASFHNAEAGLIFNSGYDANVGLLSSLGARNTVFVYDELCHASIIDGIRLAICVDRVSFAHNNVEDLHNQLQKHLGRQIFVITESVFSMDGDIAPLIEIVNLCQLFGAALIVDEAHATGVMGVRGQGLVAYLGLSEHCFARVHTFGKALGCHGAIVLGSSSLRAYLVNFARSFIYTTALSPHAIATIGAAYNYVSQPGFSTTPLHHLISYFRNRVSGKLNGYITSSSPIQAIVIGGNDATKRLAYQMHSVGLLVNAILHPTVPLGSERLRICIHKHNTEQEIDLLIKYLLDEHKTN